MSAGIRSATLLERVRYTMERHRMIRADSTMVVGVSGGPDSVALLHVLHSLSGGMHFRIVACHLDHGLRAESSEDASFVQDMAKVLGIAFVLARVDVAQRAASLGISVEEAGRRERYAVLEQVRSSCDACSIATAHHRDDALETFFLRILRGSSLQGMHGIPAKRGPIVRPLIDAGRSEIMTFLEERGLRYRIDQTNLSLDADRNFIRNRLFPVIGERFPEFRGPLTRTMALIESEETFVAGEADKLYASSVQACEGELIIDVNRIQEGVRPLRARVVLLALYNLSGPHVRWARSHVEAILRLMEAEKPSGMLVLPTRIEATREYDRIVLSHHGNAPEKAGFTITVTCPGQVDIPAARMTLAFRILCVTPDLDTRVLGSNKIFLDADLVPFPLEIRPFMPGDRFRPWGMAGTRKVKKVLTDAKIPLRMRRVWPLLVKGNEILWIPGVRRSACAAVHAETTRVLEACMHHDRK